MNALIYSYSVSAKMMRYWGPLTLIGLIVALWLAVNWQLWPLIGQDCGVLWQQWKWNDGTPIYRNSLFHNIVTVTANQNLGLEELTNQSLGLHPPRTGDWLKSTNMSQGFSRVKSRSTGLRSVSKFQSECEILIQTQWKILPEAVQSVSNVKCLSEHLMGYL